MFLFGSHRVATAGRLKSPENHQTVRFRSASGSDPRPVACSHLAELCCKPCTLPSILWFWTRGPRVSPQPPLPASKDGPDAAGQTSDVCFDLFCFCLFVCLSPGGGRDLHGEPGAVLQKILRVHVQHLVIDSSSSRRVQRLSSVSRLYTNKRPVWSPDGRVEPVTQTPPPLLVFGPVPSVSSSSLLTPARTVSLMP